MIEHTAENHDGEREDRHQPSVSKSDIHSHDFMQCPTRNSYSGLHMVKCLDRMFFEKFGSPKREESNQRKGERHE